MNSSQTVNDLGGKVCTIVRTIRDVAARVWNGVRERLKSAWGSIRALWNDETLVEVPDAPDVREIARRETVANLVRQCVGEDPIQALRDAMPEQRKTILQNLANDISREFNMPVVVVEPLETKPGTAGYYDFQDDRLVVGAHEVIRVPMDSDDAAELLDTLLHEFYHRFQRFAIQDPAGMGVSAEQADQWEQNFNHYISSEQSPRLYWLQPVEVTARCFAHAVVQNF